MDSKNTVLVVASSGDAWSALVDSLTDSCGYRALHAHSFDEATSVLGGVHIDLIVVEQSTSGHGGCDFLAELRTTHPDVMRVLAFDSCTGDIASAAVYQFLRLPLDPEQACLVVKRGLEARELSRRHRMLSREFKLPGHGPHDTTESLHSLSKSMRFEKLVYASEKMAEVCHQARIAARTDLPVLIHGETGTGKELLARAIHYNSQRQGSPLLIQNCGGVPDALLQSELFGHKRGAFTGAISDRLGLFRAANGGTVFLDEISEVSPSFQVSLLRFLQEGEIKPLGADQTVSSNVRIITASNRSLKALVASGEFRRDLYYRLKGFELELPALRERRADIAPLAEFFAEKHSEETRRRTLGISARAVEKLTTYDWPGNIRELVNVASVAATLADTPNAIDDVLTLARETPGEAPKQAATAFSEAKRSAIAAFERDYFVGLARASKGNVSEMARQSGMERHHVRAYLRKYGIDKGE
jgi:two-component system, NtrC family, response regulator HupR/HoxA